MNSNNPFSLNGKTILITGASSGIGRATAIECSRLGANVIALARRKERLEELMGELDVEGSHSIVVADLSDIGSIKDIVKSLPQLDGCVSNAGAGTTSPVQFYKTSEIERLFTVNVYAPMILVKELVKQKKLKKGASVVFTSSAGGVYLPGKANGIYDATKSALHAYMRTAALELGHKKIRLNSVNPAMVETEFIHGGSLSEEQLMADRQKYALERYGEPIDIAYGIIYLLSDAASWVTGTDLKIDGGRTLFQ